MKQIGHKKSTCVSPVLDPPLKPSILKRDSTALRDKNWIKKKQCIFFNHQKLCWKLHVFYHSNTALEKEHERRPIPSPLGALCRQPLNRDPSENDWLSQWKPLAWFDDLKVPLDWFAFKIKPWILHNFIHGRQIHKNWFYFYIIFLFRK